MSSTVLRAEGGPLPSRIGPYLVRGALGAGGMGVVYRAEHATSGLPVALKTVQAQGESVLAGIRREIHALRTLDHPGVVRIVDDGLEAGVPWYAMEVLEGPTLRRLHRERSASFGGPPLRDSETRLEEAEVGVDRASRATTSQGAPSSGTPTPRPTSQSAAPGGLRDALTVLRAVCRTLAFTHGRGIVHRDLKPENVILVAGRGPVIVDFGIAARGLGARGREILHATGRAVGSPGYMAPEQILGEIVDARADLYALGCMMFEVATGRLPFDSDSSQLVLSRKLYETAPSPRVFAPNLPDALERLIVQLLARRPGDRPGHADDVAAMLATLGAEAPTSQAPAAEPYLYRPELAGRGDAVVAIEQILASASVATVDTGKVGEAGEAASTAERAPLSAARPVTGIGTLGVTMTRGGEATLDVTSGRDLAAARHGGMVFLGGESGVGKTRLALEITTRAAQRGFRVVTGQCERVGAEDHGARVGTLRAAPLHPLRDLLHAVADRCRAMGPTGYATLLGARGPILSAFEPSFEELEGHEREPRAIEVPPEAARARLYEALGETLRAFASAEPLLLVLDDLQWADEQTLRFLAWLDAPWFDGTPVVVLGTYRVEEVGPELATLVARKGVTHQLLARLDERAVSRIVRDMLAVETPDAHLVSYLHRHTEGNPFFVSEYLRTAIDRQLLLRDENGRWRFVSSSQEVELERLPLPPTLRELVALRLQGLSEAGLQLARGLAVLGREVDGNLLAEALGLRGGLPAEAVVELLRRHVIDEGEGGTLRFLHDKLREVLYANLPEKERVNLHAAAARALGAWADREGDVDRVASELAHHHAASGAVSLALGFLDQAAERAMTTGASADALRSFELAARLFDERADAPTRGRHERQRVRWERRAAEAHHALGDLRAAEQRGRAALRLSTGAPTLLDERFEEGGRAGARFAVGAALAVGRQLAGLAVAGLARRAPGPAQRTGGEERWREAALAAEKLAETYLFLNDQNRAALASVLAANFAEHFGASPELARGRAQLAVACAYVPSEWLARAYVRSADKVARQLDDRPTDLVVDLMCGYWALGAGHFAEANERLASSLDSARALSDRRREEETIALLGMTAAFEGRLEEALIRYSELESLARRTRNTQGRMWARSGRALVWTRLGRIDEAIEAFDDVASLIEETADQTERIVIGASAYLHLRRGDRRRAQDIAESVLAMLEGTPPAGCQVLPGIESVTTTLLELWRTEPPGPARRDLEGKVRRALTVLEAFAWLFPIGLPDALRIRAAWWVANAEPHRAPPLLEKAIGKAAELGMRIEEGRCRAALALRRAGPVRAAELAEARALLVKVRAELYLCEAEDVTDRRGSRASRA